MPSNREGHDNVFLGGLGGVPDYGLHPQEPDEEVGFFENYGADPDGALGGVGATAATEDLVEDPATGDGAEAAAASGQALPENLLFTDDRIHGTGIGAESSAAEDAREDTESEQEQAASADEDDQPGAVIEVFYEKPHPPTAERQALLHAMARVHQVVESNQVPPSVKSKLTERTDAASIAVMTRIAVARDEAREAAEANLADGGPDADLGAKGAEDPEHLRRAMQETGPNRFMDALKAVDTDQEIWTPMQEAKGFAAALKAADPDEYLRTVTSRSTHNFWYGDPEGKKRAAPAEGAKPRYIGLYLDPRIVGETLDEGIRHMEAESSKLTNLMKLHSGRHRPANPQQDVMDVKSYIDGLNRVESDWLIWQGRGVPGEAPGQRMKETVSPHHAERLERYLTYARPLMDRLGQQAADQFTAQIVQEIADARIESRRQAQYRDGPEAYERGERVSGLSDDDLANLALAARFGERAAQHERGGKKSPTEVIKEHWDAAIDREDRLFQADLRQRSPELFEPGVPPPVSPKRFDEQLSQIGFNFRARLGNHMEGPDPQQRGRAAANAGLLADLEALMNLREETREKIRLARSENTGRFMGGDRPNGLSDEQVRDWALLTAIQLDVAMQPESGGAGTEADVLMQALTDITVRDMALRQNAAHQANPDDLRSGRLPPMTAVDVQTLVEMAAMSAQITVQRSGHQAAHDFIAQTALDLHQLLRGRAAHDEHGGNLAGILRGDLTQDEILRMDPAVIEIARNAARGQMEEDLRRGLPANTDAARRYQMLDDQANAQAGGDQSGLLASLRAGAQVDSARRAVEAHNRPENAVHVTSGPGPEHPELLVALAAGLGFDQISVSGTNPVNRQLAVVAGRQISESGNPDLVSQTSGYRSAATQIIQGRAPATVDPYQLLRDTNVQNIIIRDIPQNGRVINTILGLIDDTDPDALFHNEFSVVVGPTGWVDPRTLVLDMSGGQNGDDTVETQRMTVWFMRNHHN